MILFGILRSQEASLRHGRCGKNVCIILRVELFAKRCSKCRSHTYVIMQHKRAKVDRYPAMQISSLVERGPTSPLPRR